LGEFGRRAHVVVVHPQLVAHQELLLAEGLLGAVGVLEVDEARLRVALLRQELDGGDAAALFEEVLHVALARRRRDVGDEEVARRPRRRVGVARPVRVVRLAR